MSEAYRRAGVDVEAGYAVVRGIRDAVRSTRRPEVLGELGGFGGLFALGRYRDPILVSGTDGVGTKLLVAQRLGVHRSLGIDLVAMCANDVAVCGAEPLFFLDYFATGALAPEVAVAVVDGIAAGCRLAGCALIGGETAEMPGLYAPGHYDLAGFCVGVVERDGLLQPDAVCEGDVLVGLPSSGLHSNGYSLVRKLVEPLDWAADHGLGAPLGEVLLAPTRIYVPDMLALSRAGAVRTFAHITGGGFPENVPRALPPELGAVIETAAWSPPAIFGFLERLGGLTREDLYGTFNMGIGLICVTAPDRVPEVVARGGVELGRVVPREALGGVGVVLR